jgi:large subunit ribosomal protein L24
MEGVVSSMKTEFVKSWVRSKQPRKQRKYRFNAPKHIMHKFLGATLSKELRKKHGIRNIAIRKDDIVKIMRGQFKGKTGKIAEVDVKISKVYVDGIEIIKKEGTKIRFPIHASNVMITALNLEDKKRAKKFQKGVK